MLVEASRDGLGSETPVRKTRNEVVKDSFDTSVDPQDAHPVPRTHRNTLRSQAEGLAGLGHAYADMARRHRVVAAAVARRRRQPSAESDFSDWIYRACEMTAAAERLLALEIELARSFGVTWTEIAEALGTSRQAAWERFAKQSRWEKSQRLSQANQARRAALLRDLRKRIASEGDRLLAFQEWRNQGREPLHTQDS